MKCLSELEIWGLGMKQFEAVMAVAESDNITWGIDQFFNEQSFPHKVFLAVYWGTSEVHQEGFMY